MSLLNETLSFFLDQRGVVSPCPHACYILRSVHSTPVSISTNGAPATLGLECISVTWDLVPDI